MKRWHDDYPITRREWRKHRRAHVESNKDAGARRVGLDPRDVDCPCDDQPGRFRKRHAFDCGKPRCRVCHFNKYPKREKHEHEVRSDLAFQEQLRELADPLTP
jgi:hypothetical protein